MDNNEIEYTEDFVKTTDDPKHVISTVFECYPVSSGWSVGEPEIIEVNKPEGKYKVTIPLTKYKVVGRNPR